MIKIKTRTEQVIEVRDWDRLVSSTYGRPYSLQQQDGCKSRGNEYITVPTDEAYDDEMNDSVPEVINGEIMGVKFATWLARDPKQKIGDREEDYTIEMFWDRNFYPELATVANDLHAKGLLDAGEYTINIDW